MNSDCTKLLSPSWFAMTDIEALRSNTKPEVSPRFGSNDTMRIQIASPDDNIRTDKPQFGHNIGSQASISERYSAVPAWNTPHGV